MSHGVISVMSPTLPPIDRREVLRYMGAKESDAVLENLLEECIAEAKPCFASRVCFAECSVKREGAMLDLSFVKIESNDLAKALAGCDRVLVFAATVGLEIDRMIAKYGRFFPAKALCLQALGAERIEALCDAFYSKMKEQYCAAGAFLRPRFSPGYGDLPLGLQESVFAMLDCRRRIGLALNDSLLMSPSKSVTAIMGIGKEHE